MIVSFLWDIFHVVKFVFGLGALGALLGLAGLLLWFVGHAVVRCLVQHQPRCVHPLLRKFFLEEV